MTNLAIMITCISSADNLLFTQMIAKSDYKWPILTHCVIEEIFLNTGLGDGLLLDDTKLWPRANVVIVN